eukprot:scaffold43418_cov60-Phaeocystis_antarctica.AAC.3
MRAAREVRTPLSICLRRSSFSDLRRASSFIAGGPLLWGALRTAAGAAEKDSPWAAAEMRSVAIVVASCASRGLVAHFACANIAKTARETRRALGRARLVVSSQLADRLTVAKLGAAQAAAPLYAQYRHRQYLKAVAKRFPNRTAPAPSLPDATDPIHAILASLPGPIPASCTAVLALQNAFAVTTQGSARNKYLHAQCNDHGLRCRYVLATTRPSYHHPDPKQDPNPDLHPDPNQAANGTLNLERMRARARVPSLRMGFYMPV